MVVFSGPVSQILTALHSCRPGSRGVTIGVVDGVPDLTHPTFQSTSIRVLEGMVPDDFDGVDPHSTAVCSIIFGANENCLGLAPGCSGLVLPVFFADRVKGEGRRASQVDLARAMSLGIEQGVSILNVSAGQKSWTIEAEEHLQQALNKCAARDVLVVAAAGNDGCACIHLPAGVPSALAVGALGADGAPLDASNWARTYQRNGLLAPGEALKAAEPGAGFATVTGTSFAAAVISGTAALLLSFAVENGYALTALDIREVLLETATPCPTDGACDRYLVGTLNPAAALAAVLRFAEKRSCLLSPSREPATEGYGDPGDLVSETTGEESSMDASFGLSHPVATDGSSVTPSACECEEGQSAGVETPSNPQSQVPAISIPMISQFGAPGAVTQLACAACGNSQSPQIVFALGSLWFDFGTEARYDALVQQMGDPVKVNTPSALFEFLRDNPHFAAGITFILMQDQIPIYAVQPAGPFALDTYRAMLDALLSSIEEGGAEQRVSIPGYIAGTIRLLNGMTVSVVYPDLRGMYKWTSQNLVEATRAAVPEGEQGPEDDEILNFLNRVYYELRNLGISPQERAINYAATNAFQTRLAFGDATAKRLALDAIKVVRSPLCRPDSDCWDVQLQMFDPENERRANWIYRYTVDVSEVLPVTVGAVRRWAARGTLAVS